MNEGKCLGNVPRGIGVHFHDLSIFTMHLPRPDAFSSACFGPAQAPTSFSLALSITPGTQCQCKSHRHTRIVLPAQRACEALPNSGHGIGQPTGRHLEAQ